VFISHTTELRSFPEGMSYVAAVERAISAAGHVIVDMDYFPAADQTPAQVCAAWVRGCDVYVGVLGNRYGGPVRDRPEVSYTELEFDTATEAGLDRLVFLLDAGADQTGIPQPDEAELEFAARQDAFHRRVQDSGLHTRSFGSPADLGQLVERSLRELADTRGRISSGIQREQVPAEPQPVRSSKFINPPPTVAPTWFQGRKAETTLLAQYLASPDIRMVSLVGRAGIGKTALVCRLLKSIELGRALNPEGGAAAVTASGIVYLSRNGAHQVAYPTLVSDLLSLLPADTARWLQLMYQELSPADMMPALLEAFPAGEPVIVLLDNLESVMDAEREALTEPALQDALTAVLTAPAHALKVIVTTRVTPTALLTVEPAWQRQLPLDEGLGSPEAENVLRELDEGGRLGLRDAPGELLNRLRLLTRGFPRGLEAVKAILDGDRTLTPQDLVDRTSRVPEDQVVQVLVGEAYGLLDASARQVMQALAVYPAPVSEVGVDFLLRAVNPTVDSGPTLKRLVRRQLARCHDRHYDLHPLDRDYALSQLPLGSQGDSPAAFTLTGLQGRAANYFAQIRTPRESWRSLADVRPQLAEFELRCATGDFDLAAIVLQDIDADYLRVWGHTRALIDLHARIYQRITDPTLTGSQLSNMGLCHYRVSKYRRAIELLNQALTIARDIGDRQLECTVRGNLGSCRCCMGHFQEAIEQHRQALDIARDLGNHQAEGVALGCLGTCYTCMGDYRRGIELHHQTLEIARVIEYRQLEGIELGNLGTCHFSLGDYRKAIDLHGQTVAVAREIGYRQLEGEEIGYLGLCHFSLGKYERARELLTDALAIAREVGDRYDEANELNYLARNYLASGNPHRAAELFGQAMDLTVSTGDIEPAAEARSGWARAQLQLGNPVAALTAAAPEHEPPYPTEEPAARLLAGLALLELDHVDESARAFGDAVTAADALLGLADSNVAALQARALALSGLAVATRDTTRAMAAVAAFTRARAVTRAAGVAADTRRLLEIIASHDKSGLLITARCGLSCRGGCAGGWLSGTLAWGTCTRLGRCGRAR
jgi:tetratricopeptide (TPR) repeat protein